MGKISFFQKIMISFDIPSNGKSLKIGQKIFYRKETSGDDFRDTVYIIYIFNK